METEEPGKGVTLFWRLIAWIIVLGVIFGAYLIFPTWFQSLGKMLGLHQ